MGLNDIIKPKSKEEIQDLEKRGFRRDGGKWKFTINISKLVKAYDVDERTSDFRNAIMWLLKSKIEDIGILVNNESLEEFKKIIKSFKNTIKNPKPEELDTIMEKLYDWADDNNVFIESVT